MKKNLLLICIGVALSMVGTAFGQTHAFLWDPTTGIRDLGTLGGDCTAYGINDSGTVVGTYEPTDGRVYSHGFVWTEATGMVDIGVPGGGDSENAVCVPLAINSAGNVVGSARQVDGLQVAFFWSPTDGFTTLGELSTSCDDCNGAFAINDFDEVTGNLVINKEGIFKEAFRWQPGMVHPQGLGTVDGEGSSFGNGINSLGQIVGGSANGSLLAPMFWRKQTGMRGFNIDGSIFAQAQGINDLGEIVGLDQTGSSDLPFYVAAGAQGLKFLKGLGGHAASAQAINQNGVIVGYSEDTTGTPHAVRWLTPKSAPEVFSRSAENALGINNLGQIVGIGSFPR